MAASATDFYTKVGNPGTATTLAAPGHTIAGTTFNVVSTTNWPTTTGVIFAVDNYTLQTVNGVSTAVRTAGTYTEWEGVVASSTQITGATLLYGTDQNYSAGSLTRVYIPVASSRENRIVDGLIAAGLTQAGGMAAIAPTSVTSSGAVSGTTGTFSSDVSDNGQTLKTIRSETSFDYVASGCVITADSVGVNKNYSMTAGVVYIGGKRVVVSSVAAQTVAASKDRYIDVDNTGTLTNTEVTNNVASPALAANSVRLGIVVAGATTIATTGSINQGQETIVLPIASSVAYSVTDSLGNLICPRDPSRKLLGYKQITANVTTAATSATQLTGLSCPVIVPTGRKVKITVSGPYVVNPAVTNNYTTIWEGNAPGTLTTQLQAQNAPQTTTTSAQLPQNLVAIRTPATSSIVYNAGMHTSSGTATFNAAATTPMYIMVELE